MVSDRLDIMKDLFFSLKRDPHSNSGLFEHYCRKVAHADDWVLRKAVDECLVQYQVLPTVNQLLMMIHKFTPQQQTGTAPCVICDAFGLVYSVFCYKKEGGRTEILSYTHTAIDGAVYREEIIGRCKCVNGMAYLLSTHPTLGKEVDPPPFLKLKADESGMDCLFEAQQCARYYNRQTWGAPPEGKPLGKTLKGLIDNIVDNMDDPPAPEEVIDPMRASEGTKYQEDIFKEDLPF